MSICGTPFINNHPKPTKESTFRAELLSLPLPVRIRRIDEKLQQTSLSLATRGEKLLGLRGDFDALTIAFWQGFGRGLGCEDPERIIAAQKVRMRSIGHISIIVLSVVITVLAGVGAREIPELVAFIAVAGMVTLCVIIVAPFHQIARAQEVALILGQEQEPFWLTAGNIALSNLGITPPSQAKWWWKDRIALVFVRHLAVRFSLDATTGDLIWENLLVNAGNGFTAGLASQILKDLLSREPRYRQMVSAFQGLTSLENDLTFLTDLKAETEQTLSVELREAEERAAKLRREAEERAADLREKAPRESTEASQARPDPRQGVRVQSEPAKAQIERLTWNDLIIEDALRTKLETYCEILREAEAFRERGVTIPKGLLFYGEPGTGKTMTARVLAAQSGPAFVGCTTADIKQGWIGHSGQKVKEIFAAARAAAPTILFIDELEVITNDLGSSPDTIVAELYQRVRNNSTELVEILQRSGRLLETPLTGSLSLTEVHTIPEPAKLRGPVHPPARPTLLVASVVLAVLSVLLSIVLITGDPFAGSRKQEAQTKEFWRHYLAAPVSRYEEGKLYDVTLPDIVGGGIAHHCRFKGTIRSIASLPPKPVKGDMYFSNQDQIFWIWMSRSGHALEWVDP